MSIRAICLKAYLGKIYGWKRYSLCCPPRRSPGRCDCQPQVGGEKPIEPQADCRPPPMAANPCSPQYHHGKDTWKKYKYIALLICFPLIIVQSLRALGNEVPHKDDCRDYEYMRIRSKRFPWGTGVESFFHNEHVNHLPGECEPHPLDCD